MPKQQNGIDQNYICHKCIGDQYLRGEIRAEGKRSKCSYCETSRKCLKLEKIAKRTHETIEEHYRLTSDQPTPFEYAMMSDKDSTYGWERSGQPVSELLQELLETDETIATDIQEYLSNVYGYDSYESGEENPYGNEAYYEPCGPDDYRFQESWDFFRREVISRSRFFSKSAETVLEELFGNIHTLKTFDGETAVKKIEPNSDDRFVYRARVSLSEKDLETILKKPVEELGAPPSKVSKNGRMNANGISVFYGAADEETCIAEVRPPVGSYIILGRFEIIREINLLDFEIFTRIFVKGSPFDPNYGRHCAHAAFLKRLVSELTKPIMPGEEAFDYLPTQVFAEFLSEKISPRIEGIIFPSSQTGGGGKNLVLFNHSCAAEPYQLPRSSRISVNFGWQGEDDYDDSITVWEETPSDKEEKNQIEVNKPHSLISSFQAFGFEEKTPEDALHDWREKTLRLNIDQIKVKQIKSVNYICQNRHVARYRTKKENLDF